MYVFIDLLKSRHVVQLYFMHRLRIYFKGKIIFHYFKTYTTNAGEMFLKLLSHICIDLGLLYRICLYIKTYHHIHPLSSLSKAGAVLLHI